MKNNNKVVRLLLLVCFLSLSILSRAQGPGFGDDTTDASTPIDGGASILVIAGIGYGAKKIRDMRKKKMDEEGNKEQENSL